MNKLIPITSLSLIAALSVLACGGGDDSGDGAGAGGTASTTGAIGGGTSTANNGTGGANTNSGTGSSSSSTGGFVATTTPVNTGDYDTVISAGEFSFFVIGVEFLKSKATGLSCNSTGKLCNGALGGNLGGLAGADALCEEAAKSANPGDTHQWRAYLSTSSVNAIDRIGTGPWYSAPPAYAKKTNYASEGLLFGTTTASILTNRPGDSTTIVWAGASASGMGAGQNNYPFNQCYLDEKGVCVQNYGDSHDTMTGTKKDGTVESGKTCNDWTSNAATYSAALGHSWPRQFGDTGTDMNWSRSNETHACAGMINLTSTMGNQIDSQYQNGVGSEGGYGAFYCFAYSTS